MVQFRMGRIIGARGFDPRPVGLLKFDNRSLEPTTGSTNTPGHLPIPIAGCPGFSHRLHKRHRSMKLKEKESLEKEVLQAIRANLKDKVKDICSAGGLTYERLYFGDESLAGWRISNFSISVRFGLEGKGNVMRSVQVAALLHDIPIFEVGD